MKKVRIGVCLLVGICLAFSSCSNKDAIEGDKTKLTVWKAPHSDREEELWQNMINEFNKEYPDILVEFLAVPWDSVNQKTLAAFASNTPPDVSFQVEQFPTYAKRGKLVDLNEYISDEKKAGYPQSALDYCTYDGKFVGVPFVALNSLMYYNKDIFAEEGIDIPTNWDELVDAAKKATKDTDGDGVTDQWGIMHFTKPSISNWDAFTYIAQAGGDLWNDDLTNIGFDNEAGRIGLQFYSDFSNKHMVSPPIDTYSSQDEERDAFYSGKIAMLPTEITFSGNIDTNAPDLNYGVFLLPKGPAADYAHANYSFGNIGMLSIAQDSKNIDAAWKFVEFVTRPEIEKSYLSASGFFSPQLATNSLMYEGDEIRQVAAAGIANLQTSPATENFQGMWDGMKELFESTLRQTATPEEAIQQIKDKLTALNE